MNDELEVQCLMFLDKTLQALNNERTNLKESLLVLHKDESYYFYSKMATFIHSLLKQQRDRYYYHIENSSGTKEADYIDKMV